MRLVLVVVMLAAACGPGGIVRPAAMGGTGSTGRPDGGPMPTVDEGGGDDGGAGDAAVGDGGGAADATADSGQADPRPCSDLFRQDLLRTYELEISDTEMASLDAEFHNLAALQTGLDFATYHPVTFHMGGETVANAAVKLHGQSSWMQAAMLDGARGKMQFMLAFDQVDAKAAFHGVGKIVLDMPRSDRTFMHDRLAHTWLRQSGILASCAASARLVINGAYYGLYVAEEHVGKRVVQQFFPDNAGGDLWKGGSQLQVGTKPGNQSRLQTFWNATDFASAAAILDLPGTLTSWGAEALLNDADGYYNGSHNFFVYDQGAGKGFRFLPSDTDSTFDWLAVYDDIAFSDHPIYWWTARSGIAPGQHWVAVLSDAGQRRAYADAIAALLAKWDVSELQGWIDTWWPQIAADAAADPHAIATPAQSKRSIALARDGIAKRAAYLKSFVDCEHGSGADADGDGYRWCDDCDDANPALHSTCPVP
jgi:hypothetical protein